MNCDALMSEEVHTGTITLWLGTRGYGFIKDDVPSYKGVFLHARDLPNGMKGIAEGTKVSFKIGERNGKPLARDVHLQR
jgi:cold shock CspA family protein